MKQRKLQAPSFVVLIFIILFLVVARVESESKYAIPISARYPINEKPFEAIHEKTVQIPTKEVALVLCDVWDLNYMHPAYKNIIPVLDLFRKHKSTIIHAASVAEKYPDFYNPLKSEMRNLKEPLTSIANIPLMHWPTYRASKIKNEVDSFYNKEVQSKQRPLMPDISRLTRPVKGEYVINTYEELRFIAYKHGITTFIYVGGAVDYCMLTKPYGILNLKSQFVRSNFVVIVLDDCVFGQEDPEPYLRMYSRTGLALLSNSKRIQAK